jgi:hypothetical protein
MTGPVSENQFLCFIKELWENPYFRLTSKLYQEPTHIAAYIERNY